MLFFRVEPKAEVRARGRLVEGQRLVRQPRLSQGFDVALQELGTRRPQQPLRDVVRHDASLWQAGFAQAIEEVFQI